MSGKTPTIKRILREAAELVASPSRDYHAAPLETDLFEWHFTLRGPPAPSPFEGGVYHGRIVLPPAYPLKPPAFRFLTPTGRFEVNRDICLSMSGHHEETWQPAWGIRTALVAIRSFMDTDSKGQLGGMDASDEVRRRLAKASATSRCVVCEKANSEIMKEHAEVCERSARSGEEEEEGDEKVPEALRLAYREDLAKVEGGDGTKNSGHIPRNKQETEATMTRDGNGAILEDAILRKPVTTGVPIMRPESGPTPLPAATANVVAAEQQQQQLRAPGRRDEGVPAWIDKAIYGILAAILFLVWKKYLL